MKEYNLRLGILLVMNKVSGSELVKYVASALSMTEGEAQSRIDDLKYSVLTTNTGFDTPEIVSQTVSGCYIVEARTTSDQHWYLTENSMNSCTPSRKEQLLNAIDRLKNKIELS